MTRDQTLFDDHVFVTTSADGDAIRGDGTDSQASEEAVGASVQREAQYPRAACHIDAPALIKDLKHGSDGWRFIAVLSTGRTDRDGERINVNGWKFPSYNVPLFFGHMGYRDADNWIGAYKSTWVDKNKLWGEGYIPDIEENAAGRKMGKFMKLGITVPNSVGFEPYAWTFPDGKKGSRQSGDPMPPPRVGMRWEEQELLEDSLVPVPSNVDALVNQVKAYMAVVEDDSQADLLGLAGLWGRLSGAPEGVIDHTQALMDLEAAWPEAACLVRRVLVDMITRERDLTAFEKSWISRFGALPEVIRGRGPAGPAGD